MRITFDKKAKDFPQDTNLHTNDIERLGGGSSTGYHKQETQPEGIHGILQLDAGYITIFQIGHFSVFLA